MNAQRLIQYPTRWAAKSYARKGRLWLAGITLLGLSLPLTVGAVTPLSQGYSSPDKLSVGAIVSQKETSDQIVAANTSNVDSLLGVVINDSSSLLSVSNGEANQFQVATSGTVQVLVSDINGEIKRGDHVTASPVNGVGMKASGNVRILGISQSNATKTKKQTYKDREGKEHTIVLGDVPVLVNVAYYFKEPEKTIIPSAFQNVANALAGKNVSTLPIIISLVIFIVTLIVVVSIIYSMIRSSIISVGRNPMSQSAIYRDLIQMSALVLAILAVGVIAIYLVLTKL